MLLYSTFRNFKFNYDSLTNYNSKYDRLALHTFNDNMLIRGKKHAERDLLTSQESWKEGERPSHTSQVNLSFSTCRVWMSALEISLCLQRLSIQLSTPEDQESPLVDIFYGKRGSSFQYLPSTWGKEWELRRYADWIRNPKLLIWIKGTELSDNE